MAITAVAARRLTTAAAVAAGGLVVAVGSLGTAAPGHADATAYLVNVTVRPGYNFPNADAALAYGDGVCAKVAAGRPYSALLADIKADFFTGDDYQAVYLVNQAVNELCPAQIWQLRQSAVHYRGPTPP